MCVHSDDQYQPCAICAGVLTDQMVVVEDGYQFPLGKIMGFSDQRYKIQVARPNLHVIYAIPEKIVMVVSK